MTIYAVHLVARRALRDEEYRSRLKEQPEKVLADADLTEAEREALLAGDVAQLYSMGAHEYALMNLARAEVLDLDIPIFSERIREATPRLIY
jgi:predicted nuclease with RNAse H fold